MEENVTVDQKKNHKERVIANKLNKDRQHSVVLLTSIFNSKVTQGDIPVNCSTLRLSNFHAVYFFGLRLSNSC